MRHCENYWWPGLWTFVKNYIQGCGICQQFKINRSPLNPAYIVIEGANNTRPFAKCSIDLIMDLLPVEGYDSILVVVDQGLSKEVILCPCAKTITWEGTVTLLHENLFKRFGLPDKMISDRDPRFAAHAFQELLKLLNIKSNLTQHTTRSQIVMNNRLLLHVFFSSLLGVARFLLYIFLLNMQENMSQQTHVQHVFASR
jgi:hypothetical protein